MRMARLGAMDLPTALALLVGAALGSAAWLTAIVVCAANGATIVTADVAEFRRVRDLTVENWIA
jgi:hypothetical protein